MALSSLPLILIHGLAGGQCLLSLWRTCVQAIPLGTSVILVILMIPTHDDHIELIESGVVIYLLIWGHSH